MKLASKLLGAASTAALLSMAPTAAHAAGTAAGTSITNNVSVNFNVGGVVMESTSAPGVPRAAWDEGSSVVLAASSQCVRLLLASVLEPDAPSGSGARASAW